jgi:hypothetical protein
MLRRSMSPGIRRGVRFCFALGALACQLGACTFPDYVARDIPGGGTPGAGGSGKPATAGEGANESGGDPSSGTSAGGTSVGSAGEGGEAGEPVVVDIGPCGQRKFALHCYDHEQNEDESDVDCGGTRCPDCAAEEQCRIDKDCSGGSCSDGSCTRTFQLSYRQFTPQLETQAFHFEAVVESLDEAPRLLRQLTVRYYFSRNGVAEPILVGGTAFVQDGDDVTADTSFNVVRQIRGDGLANDAYVEASFAGGRILNAGSALHVTFDVSAATNEPFTQNTHHSFDADSNLHETKKLSVHYAGKRVWGRGPDVDDPPSCLVEGVNLDGSAEVVGGEQWLTSPAGNHARYLNDELVLKPATDAGREDMIRSGFIFDPASFDEFTYAAENGDYALIAYVWSEAGSETGTLFAQAQKLDTFRCQSFEGGSPWAPLGPYRITVDDGELELSSEGVVRVGGFELRRLDE